MPAPFQGEELGGYDRVPRVALRSTRGYIPVPLRGKSRRTTGAKVPPIVSRTPQPPARTAQVSIRVGLHYVTLLLRGSSPANTR